MLDRASISTQFAVGLREAEAAARIMSENVASISDTVVRTKRLIEESRRLLIQTDKLLSR